MRYELGKDGFHHCPICDGRLHINANASVMDPDVDCCPERHKRLHDSGQRTGVNDSTCFMWSKEYPFGWNPIDPPEYGFVRS